MENIIGPSKEEGERIGNMKKKSRKRKAVESSSSDSNSSSSDSFDSSSSSDDHKRRRKNRRKKLNSKFDQLITKISDLENKVKNQIAGSVAPDDDYSSCEIDPNTSGILYDVNGMQSLEPTGPPGSATHTETDPQFDFSFGTKVKDPAVPPASAAYLGHLKTLQHFEQADWNCVRYVDAQKQYVHAPGFTSLEPNAEISNYDNSKFTAHMETAFSGLTFALLKQSELIRSDMRDFLHWVQQEKEPNYTQIFTKLNDIFTNGEYPKVTSDLFQITCGHRAELIQYRRDAILNSVKDPVHKEALKRIPPSCAALFEEEKFTAILDKAGGVKNIFWPKNKWQTAPAQRNNPGPSDHATQSRNNRPAFRKNREAAKSNRQGQPKPGPSRNSYKGKGQRSAPQKGHRDQYKGRKTGSPSSHRERRSQHKRKY